MNKNKLLIKDAMWRLLMTIILLVTPRLSVKKHISFYLYTKTTGDLPVKISNENPLSLVNSGFNMNVPTKILFHGPGSSYDSDSMQTIRKAYLERGEFNIIILDYKRLIENPYIAAALYNKKIGYAVAKLIRDLKQVFRVSSSSFHAIGYSAGAHICSSLANRTHISRITGLDPSGRMPYVVPTGESNVLSSDDADFVDVIHTSMRGISEISGHVDYFPNGGLFQPLCSPFDTRCNHKMSWVYFADSISNPHNYEARRCERKTIEEARIGNCFGEKRIMGDYVDTTTRGIFYQDKSYKGH